MKLPLRSLLLLSIFLFIATGAGLAAPTITATKDDGVATGVRKVSGSTINYANTINNTAGVGAGNDATGVTFTDPDVLHTTLVGGTVKVTPIAFDDTYNAVGNTLLTVAAGSGLLANDIDPDNLPHAGTIVKVASVTHTGANLTGGGASTLNVAADGSFTYLPGLAGTGTETYTYLVTDSDTLDSVSTGTITFTVTGRVWYVVNGGVGDGRSTTPSGSPSAMSTAANAATDFIYVYFNASTLNSAFTLANGVSLIGEGVALVVNATTLRAAGSTPTIANTGGNAVTLGQNNTLAGFNIGNTSGKAIVGASVGTLSVATVAINTTGAALDLTGVSTPTVNVVLSSLTSSGGTKNVSLVGLNGTVTLGSGALSGASNNAFDVSGAGTANISYSGTITNTTARAVNIANKTGGTVALSGLVTSSGSGTGVFLNVNTGATISFTGGMALNTGANAAFTATGGGTVNVTQNNTSIINTLTTTTGTALNVANTTLGASGLTFRSISSNGTTNGIVLNNTGGSGGLTVVGDAGVSNNGSGGVIQNSTGVGVSLTSTFGVSLGYINISNSGTDGIKGTTLNGFTMNRCNVTDAATGGATGATDDGVDLSSVSGAFSMTNCLVDKAPHNDVQIDNFNTNMASFTMTGNTISNDPPNNPLGNDGVLLTMRGNSVLPSGNIQSNTFAGMRALAVQIHTNDTGRIGVNSGAVSTTTLTAANSIIVQNNTFTGNGQGVDIATSQISNLTFQVLNNTINGKVTAPNAVANTASSNAINVFTAAGADTGPTTHSFVGKIDTNIIGTQGVKDSGSGFGSGIRAVVQGQATQGVVTINNNTIREVPNATIINIFGQNGAATNSTANAFARFKVTGNSMPAISGSNLSLGGPLNTPIADTGIFVLADEGFPNSAVITGNTIYDVTTASGSFDIYLAVRTGPPAGASLKIEGTGSVSAFTLANNTLAGANKFVDEGAGSGTPSTLVAPGSQGAYPLLLALGGIEAAKEAANVPVSARAPRAVFGAAPWSAVASEARHRLGNALPVRSRTASAPPAEPSEGGVALSPFRQAQGPEPVEGLPAALQGAPAVLTQEHLDSVVAAALARWEATGLTPAQVARLRSVTFEVADLPGWYLGEADGSHIRVDNNAGGNGWHVDASAESDALFGTVVSPTRRYTNPASAPAGRIDLLTAVLHEMGHSLGLGDSYLAQDRDSIMFGQLTKGERRFPAQGQAEGAVPQADGVSHFLGSPISIGTLPAGKSVQILYSVQVENPITPGTTTQTDSQATISGSNFANVLTDDTALPGGAADKTVTLLAPPPTVTASTASRAINAPTLVINGTNFSTVLADNAVVLSSGTANVTGATATQLTLTFTTPPSLGALTANVSTTFSGAAAGSSGATQVATIVPAPTVTLSTANRAINAPTLVIAGTGFDAGTPANNTVTFNNGATGNVTAATATSLTVTFTAQPAATGSLTAIVTSFGGTSGAAVQVATIVAAPTVTANTANLAINAPTITIAGTGFDAGTPANNAVTFNNGATGNVTAATATSLTVTFSAQPAATGSLTAIVNSFGGSSGTAVQVATIVAAPTVTPNTASLATNAPTITIAGTGFNAGTPAANTVVFNNGATGNVTAATATSLTVTFTAQPASTGSLTAIVISFGGSSGAAVQVATIVAAPTVTLSTANRAINAPTVIITGTGFNATTPANNTVALSSGTGTVTAATATQLTVIFSVQPSLGSLTAVVTSFGGSSGAPVQVATIVNAPTVTLNTANLAMTAPTITIGGTGFDAVTPGANLVTFNLSATGTVTAATSTSLTVTFTAQPSTTGSLTAVVNSNGGSSGAAVQVATIVALGITPNTANLAQNATQLIISGNGFSTTPANNTVVLSSGTANVTASTATQLTCTLGGPPSLGALNATVTVSGSGSTGPTQVATIVAAPTVTPNTANLAQNATTIIIAGTGFNTTPAGNTVVFNNGATGNVTAATATQLTVSFTAQPTATGSLTAVVTSFGGSSGAPVQVATIVDVVSIAASDANATEAPVDTATYTFTRGLTAGALVVNFTFDTSAGTTASAADFSLSGGTVTFNGTTGTVTIPNSSTNVVLTLTATPESPNAAEAAETVRFNVVSGTGYAPATSPNDNATATIGVNGFVVTTTADSGQGSLRQAVLNANVAGGTVTFSDGTGGTVNFTDGTPDTINLPSGEIALASNVTIAGPGANLLTVANTKAASSTSRVFLVNGTTGVVLRGMTITGGNVAGGVGGGIRVNTGTNATIISCAISGNSSNSNGGGVATSGTGSLTVINSTISGNTTSGAGAGGGIGASGPVTVINSTISGNSSTDAGGGNGGGIWIDDTVTLTNVTITNNAAAGANSAGGVLLFGGGVTVKNSIIAANQNNTTVPDVFGSFTSGGFNLIGNKGAVTNFNQTGDQTGTGASPINPLLVSLANNGGPTSTHALLSGSPAINNGSDANLPTDTFDLDGDSNTAETLPVDQRGVGFARAIGTVDIGAFELQKSVSIVADAASKVEGNSGPTNFTFTVSRTGSTTGSVDVTYTVSGAAVNGTDFVGGTLPTGTATIADGNTSTVVTIPVNGDTTREPNEAFTVTLSSPNNGYVVTGTAATSTITNDDFEADLSITKTDGSASEIPGTTVTYTIVASNLGPDAVTAATVTDTFPASMGSVTWTAVFAGGASGAASGSGNISQLVTLPSSGTATYTVSAAISSAATGSLVNTATIAVPAGTTDTTPGNNSATDTDTLAPQSDLSIIKTDGVTTATPGGSVTYTITASNAGPSNAPSATVADTFPASLTGTWTAVGAGGASPGAASGSGNINDTANLPVGGSVTYTVTATISAAATGTLSNTATVTAGGGVTDPTPGNNSATDTDTLTPQANLAITKTDGVTTATPGGLVTYTITASNSGPSNAPGATVADTLPASLTGTWTAAGAGGGSPGAPNGSGNINDTANLPVGGSVTYTVTATIAASATGTLSNTATVSAPGGVTDPTPGNNSATDSDTLAPQANLSITKTDGVTTATPGGSVIYTITASNAGPSNAPGATVADTFPASLTGTWTAVGAGGGTATASGSGNINDTVNLPAGGSVTYTVTATISAAATGTLSNTATVTAPGGVTDPTPGNNSATDSDTLAPQANLAITKTDGVTTATAGGSVTYTITASNAGPSNVTGATVADTFPASLTGTWTAVGAGGGTATAAGSSNINDTVNLPAGGSVTYTVSCSLSAAASGTLSNTATVTAPGGVTDPTPGNNSATDSDTIVKSGDLAIIKTDGVTTATPGGSVTYTITASNAGPSNITGATVADTFPASLTGTWTSVGAGGGTATASGSGNINDTVNLPVGGSVTYTVSATISPAATGTLTNTATVTAPGGATDPNSANNSATDTDTLTPSADLAITKTDGVTTANAGGPVTYTITASNAGPSNAVGATVADTLPASLSGVTWTAVGAGGGTATASGSGNINDTVNLPVGGSVTYTVSGTLSPAASGTLTNTATVTAPGGVTDPNPANNSATDSDTIVQLADLAIDLAAPTTAPKNTNVAFDITLTNNGPAAAASSSVSFPIPSDMTFVSATPASGWNTSAPAPGAGGTVTFTKSTFASGSPAAVFSVVLKVKPTTPTGTIINATATASSSNPDPNLANNSDSVAIAVGTVDPTPLQVGSTGTLNRNTGLFELTVNVTNTTPLPINGFRLHVNFAAYLAAYPSLRLYNASSALGAPDVFVNYPYPVAVDGTIPVKLSFYTSTRTFPNPFNPILTVEALPTSAVSDAIITGVPARITLLPNGNIMIEFDSVPGHWYRVRYSTNDMAHWFDSPVPIQAANNRMQWIDSGAPFTDSPPPMPGSRFYRVYEIPTP